MLDKAVYSITALGEIAELFTRAYPDKPFEEAQRAAYRIAARLEATGPERDLAEQTLEKLEWLARMDEDGVDYIGLRIVYSRVLGGYSYSKTRCGDSTRAEALALLREKGAGDGKSESQGRRSAP